MVFHSENAYYYLILDSDVWNPQIMIKQAISYLQIIASDRILKPDLPASHNKFQWLYLISMICSRDPNNNLIQTPFYVLHRNQ